ncbi:MAG: hypothetical protein ABI887_01365 [Burkholderiales bacterium]
MKSTQRDALKRSEKKAAEPQPENFKDEATEEKTVEIGPDRTNAPIHGIDPPRHEPAKRLRRGRIETDVIDKGVGAARRGWPRP